MSNCFETIKKNPSVLIGLSVLTLGVLPIGYLGYRLVQWISHTELFEKVSNCFKKYCCCLPRQQDRPNIGLVGTSSGVATEEPKPLSPRRKRTVTPKPVGRSSIYGKAARENVPSTKRPGLELIRGETTVTQEPVSQSPIPKKVPLKSIPFADLDSPVAPQGTALESALPISSAPEEEALSPPLHQPPKNFTNPPPETSSFRSLTEILDSETEAYRFYNANDYNDSDQLQYLRDSKNTFMKSRQAVQNGILKRILCAGILNREFDNILDEYLKLLSDARRQGFEAAFKLKAKVDYSPLRINDYRKDINEIFKDF